MPRSNRADALTQWRHALDDPAGQGVDAVRPIRDDIRRRIETLIAEIAPA